MIVGVFGVRGGGTSAIAGVVHLLGFPFHGKPKTLDDEELKASPTKEVIESRGNHWMFKHPFLLEHIDHLTALIPGLKIIYVLRDPLSTALHGSGDIKESMLADLKLQRKMLKGPDGLFVSYEKAIMDPEGTVNQIAEYLEVPVNHKAVAWLEPSLKYRDIADYE